MKPGELEALLQREMGERQARMQNVARIEVKPTRQALQDLLRIGPQKPLGNLPLRTMYDLGEDPQMWVERARGQGLLAKVYEREAHGMLGGYHAIAIADPLALGELLQKHRRLLTLFQWSLDSEQFMDRVNTESIPSSNPIYRVIALAFGNTQHISLPTQVHQGLVAAHAVTTSLVRRFG